MTKIAVVIVNWNTGKYLASCLRSLAEMPDDEKELIDEVIVVDNASRDGSVVAGEVEVGKAGNKPRVRFIAQQTNTGFAAGNNTAFKRIRAKGKPVHVLLLNPDTRIKPGTIKGLVGVLDNHADAGIVGPKILNPDESLQKSVRAYPSGKSLILYMLKLGVLVPELKMDYEKEQATKQVMGAAMLIRDEAFKKVGDMDERFFVWFEEVDYCKRAEDSGWKIYYTPKAEIYHKQGVSFSHLVGFKKTWPWLKSLIHYAEKHKRGCTAWLLVLLSPITLLLSVPAGIKHLWQKDEK